MLCPFGHQPEKQKYLGAKMTILKYYVKGYFQKWGIVLLCHAPETEIKRNDENMKGKV